MITRAAHRPYTYRTSASTIAHHDAQWCGRWLECSLHDPTRSALAHGNSRAVASHRGKRSVRERPMGPDWADQESNPYSDRLRDRSALVPDSAWFAQNGEPLSRQSMDYVRLTQSPSNRISCCSHRLRNMPRPCRSSIKPQKLLGTHSELTARQCGLQFPTLHLCVKRKYSAARARVAHPTTGLAWPMRSQLRK